MIYSLEILRIIAVVLVILFHANVVGFENGFLGVDIFLFISGFLMMRRLSTKDSLRLINIIRFYESRLVRILPLLYLMSAFSIPFAYFFFLPEYLENFGQSLVASTWNLSNILFFITSNYWDLSSELKPLLHTWSLGLEIQFYFLLPLLLLASEYLRLGRKNFLLIVGIFSLLLSLYFQLYNDNTSAVYYLLPFRIFEFLAGSIFYFRYVKSLESSRFRIYSVISLTTIFFILFFFETKLELLLKQIFVMIFSALVVDILRYSKFNFSSILLRFSTRVYAIYLFHQPVFSFLKNLSKDTLDSNYLLLSIIPIWFISDLTYKHVESPIMKSFKINPNKIRLSIVSSGLLISLIGLYFHFQNGLPDRFVSLNGGDFSNQTINFNEEVRELKINLGDSDILVVGDSFARDFVNVLVYGFKFPKHKIAYTDINIDSKDQLDSLYFLIQNNTNLKAIFFANKELRFKNFNEIQRRIENLNLSIKVVGPKNFGVNINFLTKYPISSWPEHKVAISAETIEQDIFLKRLVSPKNYISLVDIIGDTNKNTPIVTSEGKFISIDSEHLTLDGSLWISELLTRSYPDLLNFDVDR